MAAGNCAAEVSHRRLARRRCRLPPPLQQQQGQQSTAVAATVCQRRVRPSPPGVIPCNLRRHADAICILAKVQLSVVKQMVAGADKDLINTLSECAANILNGTWSCSLIRSNACPGMQTPWEPSDSGQWVSLAGRPCWWTGASRDCWPALWHRCSSRPCPPSWAVWALWSGSWSDVGVSKKKGCAGQHDLQYLQYRPSRVGARSLLLLLICQRAERTTAAAAVCHPEMDPGKAGTLRDLLSAHQKGPQHRHHHQPVVLNEKKKAWPPSAPPGLVDDDVPSPDAGDGATQWLAWDIGRRASKARPAAP